ncbi:MAG: hypothetical protein OHK0012_07860 [Synechococcales cyanobacterium]
MVPINSFIFPSFCLAWVARPSLPKTDRNPATAGIPLLGEYDTLNMFKPLLPMGALGTYATSFSAAFLPAPGYPLCRIASF